MIIKQTYLTIFLVLLLEQIQRFTLNEYETILGMLLSCIICAANVYKIIVYIRRNKAQDQQKPDE
jgi:polyferredoxin